MTYKPAWKGPIEGYVVNFISRELWKVQATMERGDLIQEAWLVFDRVEKKYPGVDAPHFMALFKTAWSRHFTDLANADTKQRTAMVPITARKDDEGQDMAIREPVGDLENDGVLATLLRQAPREVLTVLQLFLSAPQELLEIALDSWNADSQRPGGGSARINRLLGFPTDYDAVGAVREYFNVTEVR